MSVAPNRAYNNQIGAAFDVIGRYNQDNINGFSLSFIESLLDVINPQNDQRILELMAGDGNLSKRVAARAKSNSKVIKELALLEYSRVQSEFAKLALSQESANVYWGDVISMRSLHDSSPINLTDFDTTIIKSSNHEIPDNLQQQLYRNVFKTLSSNGRFINLGFLFDDKEERDEIREIARVKDSLANMQQAVQNRHFLIRDEFYKMLSAAGFVDIKSVKSFQYAIRSNIVSDAYFTDPKKSKEYDLQFQASQIRAYKMRQNGRILFERESSIMYCPGEITSARRPTHAELKQNIFNRYPYHLVKHISAHRELLEIATNHVSKAKRILDLGCGIGLLTERLVNSRCNYDGVDLNQEFISHCQEQFREYPQCNFLIADMNQINPPNNHYQAVTLLNSLYIDGVDPIRVLQKAFDALSDNGVLVVSGPTSVNSFKNAELHIRKQLNDDGLLPKYQEEFDLICKSNSELLTDKANYWSVEGIIELLRQIGFEAYYANTSLYYGNAFVVCAKKP